MVWHCKGILEDDSTLMHIAVTFTSECPRLWGFLKEWSCAIFGIVGESLRPHPTPHHSNIYWTVGIWLKIPLYFDPLQIR